ncbi:HAD hydrolase-like protein [Candidatus Dependentiae bacterium]|nr:HAD hydrolase-like protein [Candidatus Dependentiae bacterium]
MFKRVFLSIFFAFSANLYSAPLLPENTVIAVDLHGVVLNMNFLEVAKTAMSHCKDYRIFKPLLNPIRFIQFLKLALKTQTIEKLIEDTGVEYPNILHIKKMVSDIQNCQNVNKELVQILEKLKSLNYKIYILSNIGPKTLQDLRHKKPDFVNLFDDHFIPCQENNYLSKPDSAYYITFKDKFNLHDKRIIFLDDRHKNVKAALQENFDAILFQNNDQILSELNKLLPSIIKQ